MIDGMMRAAIQAMGFEPEEFREMVSEALDSMVEMGKAVERIEKRLDRLETILEAETIKPPVNLIEGTKEKEHEAQN